MEDSRLLLNLSTMSLWWLRTSTRLLLALAVCKFVTLDVRPRTHGSSGIRDNSMSRQVLNCSALIPERLLRDVGSVLNNLLPAVMCAFSLRVRVLPWCFDSLGSLSIAGLLLPALKAKPTFGVNPCRDFQTLMMANLSILLCTDSRFDILRTFQ